MACKRVSIPCMILPMVFIFHIVGYALPRWFTIQIIVSDTSLTGYYHIGLWQDLSCMRDICQVGTKHTITAWLKAVQAMQTLGLIGLITSGILCSVILFRPPQTEIKEMIKRINVGVLFCSGTFILIGLIVFQYKSRSDFEELINHLDIVHGPQTNLDIAYILCLMATVLCLALCAPLFLLDAKDPLHADEQQTASGCMQNSNQSSHLPQHT